SACSRAASSGCASAPAPRTHSHGPSQISARMIPPSGGTYENAALKVSEKRGGANRGLLLLRSGRVLLCRRHRMPLGRAAVIREVEKSAGDDQAHEDERRDEPGIVGAVRGGWIIASIVHGCSPGIPQPQWPGVGFVPTRFRPTTWTPLTCAV